MDAWTDLARDLAACAPPLAAALAAATFPRLVDRLSLTPSSTATTTASGVPPRPPNAIPLLGVRVRDARERTARNTARPGFRTFAETGKSQIAPVRAAPDVLHALEHDKRVRRVTLAGPHLTVGAVSMMHGPSGVGKSRWLSEVVRAVTRGEPVFGWPTVQGAVVWVTEESLVVWKDKAALMARPGEAARWWDRRLRARFPRRYPPTVWPLSLPDLQLEPTAQTFPDLLALVEREVRRTGARLVILDTLMAVCPQAVKDNEVAKTFIRQCAALAHRAKVAVELVHHDNNDGNPLGAKMLKGACDYTHHVFAPDDEDDDRVRAVEFGKRYEPYPPPPLRYRMGDDGRLVALDVRSAPGVSQEECAPRSRAEHRTAAPTVAETMALVEAAHALEPALEPSSNPVPVATTAPAPAPIDSSPRGRVLETLAAVCASEGYATIPQLMLLTGFPKTTTWNALKSLEAEGAAAQTKGATRTAPSRWTLTAAPAVV